MGITERKAMRQPREPQGIRRWAVTSIDTVRTDFSVATVGRELEHYGLRRRGKRVAKTLVLHYGESRFAGKRVSYAHASEQLTIAQVFCPEHIAS
jgi:hypothetical protein